MGPTLTARLEGIGPFVDRCDAEMALCADLAPVWALIRVELQSLMAKEFTSGGPAKEKWAPLKESTLKSEGPHPILMLTGRLFWSLAGDNSDSIFVATPQDMVWGTDVPYAKWHQEGTDRMPARKLFDEESMQAAVTVGLAGMAGDMEAVWHFGSVRG